jgi:ATP-dependent exoDNAse (exonuclease V) alpha subunit
VSAGDRVMTLRNDAGLGVQNGMWATVLGPAPEGGLRVVAGAGAVLELPADYLEDGDLTYGYAITAHKAQGMTVEQTFELASEGIDRQWGYTALSRARSGTRLYLAGTHPALGRDRDDLGGRHVSADQAPVARLADDLARDRSQEAALERLLGRDRSPPEHLGR